MSLNDRELPAPDGTRIAFRVEGSGPALVLTNGLTTTTTFWEAMRTSWLRRHTVVTWDLPGHGRSGPALTRETATMQAQPGLVTAVMQAAGVQRAHQVGWSTGAQIVLETYRQFPERCESLVLLLGPAGRVLQTTRLPLNGDLIALLMQRTPPRAFEVIYRTLAPAMGSSAGHVLGRWLGLIGKQATPEDVQRMTDHIATVDARTLQLMVCSAQLHSAHDVLGSLRVPLLIVAGDKDPFAPSELVGIPLHEAAPGSELLRLAEGTHTALLEEPERIAQAVEDFIARRT